MTREIHILCQRPRPVVRFAGGALIGDLPLMDNLFLELSLCGLNQPAHLLPEIEGLFALAGRPVCWDDWRATPASSANKEARAQVLVGRALAVDPDLLLLDFGMWNLGPVDPGAFSRSFSSRYPWRALVWACVDVKQSDGLRRSIPELCE